MRYQVKRVSGAQAETVRHLGLVKVAESSARDLFDLGVPRVVPETGKIAYFVDEKHVAGRKR